MKKGDRVKLVTGTAEIEITKIHPHDELAFGRYCSSGMHTGWRPFHDFQQFNPKEDTMSKDTNSALIALLQAQRGMTTAKVRLKDAGNSLLTYKVIPGMTLNVDDFVVAQSGNTVKIGKVVELDNFADIDLESGLHYKWIVQKIDLAAVKAIVEEEVSLSKQFAAAEAQEKMTRLANVAGLDLTSIQTPMLEVLK